MRTDCKRHNCAILLPNASTLGFGLYKAKRGNWVRFNYGEERLCGRVVGGVVADGKRYIEVIALLGACHIPAVRWIEAEDVIECRSEPPRKVFEMICGDWDDPTAILQGYD